MRDLRGFPDFEEYVYYEQDIDNRMNVTRYRLSKPIPFQSSESEESVSMA